jgi:hypothetical protein
VSAADVLEEVLQPPGNVTANHLELCISEWNELRVKNGKGSLPGSQLSKLAEGIVERAPERGKARLEFLNNELRHLLEV